MTRLGAAGRPHVHYVSSFRQGVGAVAGRGGGNDDVGDDSTLFAVPTSAVRTTTKTEYRLSRTERTPSRPTGSWNTVHPFERVSQILNFY